MAKQTGSLARWFKEEWIDIKTGKPCDSQRRRKELIPRVDRKSVSLLKPLKPPLR